MYDLNVFFLFMAAFCISAIFFFVLFRQEAKKRDKIVLAILDVLKTLDSDIEMAHFDPEGYEKILALQEQEAQVVDIKGKIDELKKRAEQKKMEKLRKFF